jgi:small-conductance mechanosensitive channel
MAAQHRIRIGRRLRIPPFPPRFGGLVIGLFVGLALVLAALPMPGLNGAHAAPTPAAAGGCAAPPQMVRLDGRPVLEIRRAPAAQRLSDYTARAGKRLQELARDRSFEPEELVLREEPPFTLVGLTRGGGSFVPEMAVDDRLAACFGLTRQQLAGRYRDAMVGAFRRYRSSHSLSSWLRGTGLAAVVLALYLAWLQLQTRLNGRLRRAIERHAELPPRRWLPPALARLVDRSLVRRLLQRLRQLLHWGLVALLSYLLIPLLLGLFPPTQGIAAGLRGQIAGLVFALLNGAVQAIPNALSIAVILTITVLVIRISNAWFAAVHAGQIQIPGFYQEWALPTARLVAILLGVAGVVAAYPYIPGSGSKVFQGAGLFVGVLAALGSSAIASNIISGLMLIYTRAFREGDRVEINGVVGVVQDRALLVTRLQTPRNELVSIPNATVIGASVVNFSFARREIRQPVALATTITIGYDVPWRQVHALMLAAARSVAGITDEVAPFVLQTALNDFHISYELNAFVRDAATYRETLSAVLAALQDQFAAAGVEILSPAYHAIRNGDRSTVPPQPSLPQEP